MRNLAWLSAIAALLVVPSSASGRAPSHYKGTLRAVVCSRVVEMKTPIAIPASANDQYVDAWIGRHRLKGVSEGDHTVYLVGAATAVEVHALRRTAPLTVLAVRTVPKCARLRLVYEW